MDGRQPPLTPTGGKITPGGGLRPIRARMHYSDREDDCAWADGP